MTKISLRLTYEFVTNIFVTSRGHTLTHLLTCNFIDKDKDNCQALVQVRVQALVSTGPQVE